MRSLLDDIARNKAASEFQRPAPGDRPKAAETDSRRIAWHRLQQASPETARFLAECGSAFGRPVGVRLTVDGEVIYQHGDVDP